MSIERKLLWWIELQFRSMIGHRKLHVEKKTKGRIIGFDKKICQSFLDIKLRFG